MGPRCKDTCKKSCFKITDEHRQNIFKQFWELGDNNIQRLAIHKLIDTMPPKQRIKEVDEHIKSRRNNTHVYKLLDENKELVVVCKKFFFNTFGK